MIGRTPFILLLAIGGACATGGDEIDPAAMPSITGLDVTSAAVGDDIRISGTNFIAPAFGWVDVTFRGDFVYADGSGREPVDLTIAMQAESPDAVVWEGFGGYRVPFGDGYTLGHFEGFITATNRYFDGSLDPQLESTRRLFTIEVLPSIVVLDFLAVDDTWMADCAEPSTNLLHHLPYLMHVAALGFDAESFRFDISEGLLVNAEPTTGITSFEVFPTDSQHALRVQFAYVPEASEGYRAWIAITATTRAGERVFFEYNVVIRRPLEVYFTTPMQVAELYEPTPVSGCLPGGPSSIETTYSETHSETRSLSRTQSATQGWEVGYSEQHSSTYGRTESRGGSIAITRGVTTTDSRTEGGSNTTTDMLNISRGRSKVRSGTYTRRADGEWGWTVNDQDYGEDVVERGGTLGVPGTISGNSRWGWVDGDRHDRGSRGAMSWGSAEATGVQNGNDESVARSHARADSSHWARTLSYAETNSYTSTETWNNSQTYTEGISETESLGRSFNETVSETMQVSSTSAESLNVRAWVWAGMRGMWYRQTTRLERRAAVVAYDLCGNGSEVGEVMISDWTWAPDLALGDTCPPATNFEPAQCLISPCDPQ